jgi:hypothetical protein
VAGRREEEDRERKIRCWESLDSIKKAKLSLNSAGCTCPLVPPTRKKNQVDVIILVYLQIKYWVSDVQTEYHSPI